MDSEFSARWFCGEHFDCREVITFVLMLPAPAVANSLFEFPLSEIYE
jgi:hypothetical protein